MLIYSHFSGDITGEVMAIEEKLDNTFLCVFFQNMQTHDEVSF